MTFRAEQQPLGTFYASAAGRLLLRRLFYLINACWPSLENKRLLTVGYATPFIRFFQEKHPASLTEVDVDSDGEKTLALKTTETAFPFRDKTFDAVFVVNTLEKSAFPDMLFSELRRILNDDGTLLLVRANRQTPWSCLKNTPVVTGTLYTERQIRRLMRKNVMTVTRRKQTLFFPKAVYDLSPLAEKTEETLAELPFGGAFSATLAVKTPAVEETAPFYAKMKKAVFVPTADSQRNITETSLKK